MPKTLLYLSLILTACGLAKTAAAEAMVAYFDHGQYFAAPASAAEQLDTIADEMLYGADNTHKKAISEDLIEAVKQATTGIEIIYDAEKQVAVYGQILYIDRMLIPFCPDQSCADQPAILYLGRGEYFSPIYINSKGGAQLDKLKQITGN